MSLPAGIIALWTGTLSAIPSNWNLCNGSGVTPNLISRFLKGAASSTDPGSTGGNATHNHTMASAGAHAHTTNSSSHSHTLSVSGDQQHNHGLASNRDSGARTTPWMVSTAYVTLATHSHTSYTNSHSHTTASNGAHTHTIDTASNNPAYYEVAFIQAALGAEVTSGIICFWSGSLVDIPANWSACDGSGGRPNLNGKFLKGVATNTTDPGDTGGSDTHTHTLQNNASHSHTHSDINSHRHNTYANSWSHSHNRSASNVTGTSDVYTQTDSGYSHSHSYTGYSGEHTHTIGSGGVHKNHLVNNASSLPSYIEAVPIYSSDTAFRVGCICIWSGTLATIPSNWSLCDGTGSTPDYTEKFIRGTTSTPGTTSGSATHTHTEAGTAGAHTNHSWTTEGAHYHSTSSGGSHTHAYSTPAPVPTRTDFKRIVPTTSGGSHKHGNTTSSGSHNHTTNSSGAHDHQTWSNDNQEPEYYEVAFIICTSEGELFPDQYSGLRIGNDEQVVELCLVDAGEGATGMGGIPKIHKGGTTYDIYLVETDDSDASPVRIKTTTGIKAIRKKT